MYIYITRVVSRRKNNGVCFLLASCQGGKIRAYRPCYENGTGKPCYKKPDNLPEPRDRSKSPKGAKGDSKSKPEKGTIQARIAKHKTMVRPVEPSGDAASLSATWFTTQL